VYLLYLELLSLSPRNGMEGLIIITEGRDRLRDDDDDDDDEEEEEVESPRSKVDGREKRAAGREVPTERI
jgi:hypothetical protein